MNIFFITLIIFVIVYVLLTWFARTSAKKISRFIRILIIPPDSEFATFQQDLLSMGSFSLTFGIMLIIYIFGIFILGTGIKVFGDNE